MAKLKLLFLAQNKTKMFLLKSNFFLARFFFTTLLKIFFEKNYFKKSYSLINVFYFILFFYQLNKQQTQHTTF